MERLPRAQAHIERSDPVDLALESREGDLRAADSSARLARNHCSEIASLEDQVKHTEPLSCEVDELIEVFGRVSKPLRLAIKGHFDPF